MYNFFNPKVKEILDENPDTSIIGLFWAGYWRFIVMVWGVVFLLICFSALLSAFI